MKSLTIFEGTSEPIEDVLLDEAGQPVALDNSYLINFRVVREGTNETIFLKSSADSSQIAFDGDQNTNKGVYQILRLPADTRGKAGRHVYSLDVKRNDAIFRATQGTLIIKGVNEL